MSFKKNLSYNIVIQAIGPLLSFLTIFIIAKFAGAEIQGKYASIAAWINLAVVIGTFGFPQGFIYLINKLNVVPRLLFEFTCYYSVLFILSCHLIILLLFELHLINPLVINNLAQILCISIPITILVFHGLLRGIYLTYNESKLFATFSILPAVLLFPFVLAGIVFSNYNFLLIYLFSSIPVFIISLILIRPAIIKKEHSLIKNIPWTALFNHGTNSFLQAFFFAFQPIVAYWFINKYVGNELEIGYFNLGLFLVQGLLVPISMVAPLLFNYLTKNSDHTMILKFTSVKVFVIELLIGAFIAFSLQYLIPYVFGSEYISSIEVVQILLFITPLIFHARILIPAIHSKGYQRYNTITGLIRLAVFIVLSYLWMQYFDQQLIGLAFSWSMAELTGSLVTIKQFIALQNRETI